jgi:hypothetical protein
MPQQPRSTRKPASAEQDFWNELEAPAKQFLTADEKGEMAQSAYPFYVTDVELVPSSQFGDRWELQLEWEDKDPFNYGTARPVLTLPAHGARNHIMRKLQSVATSKKVGPLVLTITEIDGGNTWMALKRPDNGGKA